MANSRLAWDRKDLFSKIRNKTNKKKMKKKQPIDEEKIFSNHMSDYQSNIQRILKTE